MFRVSAVRTVVVITILCAAGTVSAQSASRLFSFEPSDCGVVSCGEETAHGCTTSDTLSACTDLYRHFDAMAGETPLLADWKGRNAGKLNYSVGGQLRHRYMNERNRLRPGGPGQTDYDLWRFAPHVELNYDDTFGVFAEAIDASAFGYDAPFTPVGIDVNRADILQLYAEVNLGRFIDFDGTLKYRYGRQFLKYGSQRLLSSLAWGNTFRNFEGHKLIASSGDWDVDVFGMQSVNAAAGGAGFGTTSADKADGDRWIIGVYSTFKGIEDNDLDLYWLYFDDATSSVLRHDGRRHTIGARLSGKQDITDHTTVVGTWDWDFEGAYQFGEDRFGPGPVSDVSAGMFAVYGGYTFSELPWAPRIGGICYWSSGDSAPSTGDINTFYSHYPLAHAWWGQIDNFSGQNLIDVGVNLSAAPHKKLKLDFQWHHFELTESNDSIYTIVGAPFASSGASEIGQEADIVATIPVSATLTVQAGYFWFFYGNAPAAAQPDASQFYVQTTWSF